MAAMPWICWGVLWVIVIIVLSLLNLAKQNIFLFFIIKRVILHYRKDMCLWLHFLKPSMCHLMLSNKIFYDLSLKEMRLRLSQSNWISLFKTPILFIEMFFFQILRLELSLIWNKFVKLFLNEETVYFNSLSLSFC